ncbi:pyridoxal-phosphate dependent enzyme [Empedobacter falsenii]
MNNHFPFTVTPITKLSSISHELNCNFFMKRDDLFEHGGGGSKARMLQFILYKAKEEGADYILTAGGPYSNFNRALALLAPKFGFKVRLILFDKNKHIQIQSLNKRILDLSPVELIECDPNKVEETIAQEYENLILDGHKPFYIWGGGKSNEGVEAYVQCYQEIHDQVNSDFIFTALGTGTTFSGLYSANQLSLNDDKIIGVSVAREKKICSEVITDIINQYNININSINLYQHIIDDYLLGGYGCVTDELENFMNNFIFRESLIIDSIYVGKALYGTVQYIKNNQEMFAGKNVVFLNTGGIYNF